MKSCCLFASYFKGNSIPHYIKIYLLELKKHNEKLIFINSNEQLIPQDLFFLSSNNIDVLTVSNEGFDFGQWYKALQTISVSEYDYLSFVNDSCVLFSNLTAFYKWVYSSTSDVFGITQSQVEGKHLQSYFLVFKKNTFPTVLNYFNKYKIVSSFAEVISTYEIGLSKEIISKGYSLNSFLYNKNEHPEFAPYFYNVKQHITDGIPIIKRKIIDQSYRKDELFTLTRMNFDINPNTYINLINQQQGSTLINLNELKTNDLSFFQLLKFHSLKNFILVVKKIKSFV